MTALGAAAVKLPPATPRQLEAEPAAERLAA
jgi:hypothetical protein